MALPCVVANFGGLRSLLRSAQMSVDEPTQGGDFGFYMYVCVTHLLSFIFLCVAAQQGDMCL